MPKDNLAPKKVYLAKGGNVFGPLPAAEFQALKESGKINSYSWMWDFDHKEWKPLDPPPPPLVFKKGETAVLPTAKSFSQRLLAICHDYRAAVSGTLVQMTETGCELVSDSHPEAPVLSQKSKVLLNLLDPKSGKSVNVRGNLSEIRREKAGWIYKIHWDYLPNLA